MRQGTGIARGRCLGLLFVSIAVLPLVPDRLITQASTAVPAVQWQPCASPTPAGFECTSVPVPLDHAHPDGTSITLAVIRHPATEPDNRIGVLFFNPGGPGGQGTIDVPGWLSLFPATVRARFDIVSWDPRGIGASTAVQCFANAD